MITSKEERSRLSILVAPILLRPEVRGVIPKVFPTGNSSFEFDVSALSCFALRDASCVMCRACDVARVRHQ